VVKRHHRRDGERLGLRVVGGERVAAFRPALRVGGSEQVHACAADHHRAEAPAVVGEQPGGVATAHRIAEQAGLADLEVIEQPYGVARDGLGPVGLDLGGLAALAVAARVQREHAVTGTRQRVVPTG